MDENSIYRFYDHDSPTIGVLRVNCPKEQLEELLKNYRESEDGYNWEDWVDYLSLQGFTVECLTPDHDIYF